MEESKPAELIKVAVLVVGNVHRDHGPPIMLLQQIKQLIKLGCNVVYCDEMTTDLSLPLKIMLDGITTEASEKYRSLCHTDKTHVKSYFRSDDLEKVSAVAKSRTDYDQIIGINAHPAEKTLGQYLLKTKIPYHGLEPPATEWEEMQKRFAEGDAVAEFEQPRTEYMTQRLVQKVFPNLKQNTVVICNVGVLHSHRIAAKVLEQHAQNQDSPCDIKLIPMVCFSNYIDEEERTLLLDKIQEMRQADPSAIVKRYETLPPLQAVTLKETKNGEDFESEEFCKAFQETAMFVKPPRFYFIPNLTDEKRAVVTALRGTIIESGDNICARLRSCDLTAERRKILGIERRLITLSGPNKDTQLKTLESRKTFIAVEPTAYPNKYLVTFPPNELSFIESVIQGKKEEKTQGNLPKPG